MKTTIPLKTALIKTTTIVALGTASLLAQDEIAKNTAIEPNESTRAAQAQNQSPKMQYSGKLVSLTEYLGNPHEYSSEKGRTGKGGGAESGDSAAANKTASMKNQPLGFLMNPATYLSGQSSQPGQPGQAGQPAGTAQAGERAPGSLSAPGQQLCILLFDGNNEQLVAKAHALCNSAKANSASTSGARTGAEANQSAPENRAAGTTKESGTMTVSVSGRKVMRDGLTAIFVDDIQGGESISLRQ